MGERSKRRSAGQKIGRDGELVFERWANRNGLSVNKSVQDMGIDYFCEHLKPITPGVLPLAQRHGRSVTLRNSRTLPFGGEFSMAKERAAGETAEKVQKEKAQ